MLIRKDFKDGISRAETCTVFVSKTDMNSKSFIEIMKSLYVDLHLYLWTRRFVIYENLRYFTGRTAARVHRAVFEFTVFHLSDTFTFFHPFANGSRTFPMATEWLFTADVSPFLRGLFQCPGFFYIFVRKEPSVSSWRGFFQMEVDRNTYCCSANADGSLDATLFCHMTFFTTSITLTLKRVSLSPFSLFTSEEVWLMLNW